MKTDPYSIARSTLGILFPFSIPTTELEKDKNHELGWIIHPVHFFYIVTNLYYFPYYIMQSDIAPYYLRLLCAAGFIYGVEDHLCEYYGYLTKQAIPFGENPLLQKFLSKNTISGIVLVASGVSAIGLGLPLYQHLIYINASIYFWIVSFFLFLAMGVFVMTQIPRGEGWAYARSSRYHFEHVIGHYIGSVWMKYFSWEYCGENSTNVRLEMMFLTAATLGLCVHMLQLDSALKMQDHKNKN